MAKKVVIIFGVSGVGKSSVLSKFLERSKEWFYINFGDIMLEILKKEGLSRDDLRKKLDLNEYKILQKETIKRIKEIMRDKEKIIIDTHACIILHKYGFYPGFPENSIKELNPTLLILITAKPEEVLKRREKDLKEGKREREIDIELVRKEVEMEMHYASIYSVISGVPLKIIENKEGLLEKAREELRKTLENI